MNITVCAYGLKLANDPSDCQVWCAKATLSCQQPSLALGLQGSMHVLEVVHVCVACFVCVATACIRLHDSVCAQHHPTTWYMLTATVLPTPPGMRLHPAASTATPSASRVRGCGMGYQVPVGTICPIEGGSNEVSGRAPPHPHKPLHACQLAQAHARSMTIWPQPRSRAPRT